MPNQHLKKSQKIEKVRKPKNKCKKTLPDDYKNKIVQKQRHIYNLPAVSKPKNIQKIQISQY
jgi:hypothetical protein